MHFCPLLLLKSEEFLIFVMSLVKLLHQSSNKIKLMFINFPFIIIDLILILDKVLRRLFTVDIS